MKIFLNENFIQLEEKKPLVEIENMTIHGCSSVEEVDRVFKHFENKGELSNLLLYPVSIEFDLIHGFISLFKLIEAAGGIVKNEENEILFIYRWEKWDLPKGKLHKKNKESKEDGAIREVTEETGLKKISIIKELFPTFHIYYENEKRILKKTWWFAMAGKKDEMLKPQEEEGITRVRWVAKNDIGLVLANTYASLLELITSPTLDT